MSTELGWRGRLARKAIRFAPLRLKAGLMNALCDDVGLVQACGHPALARLASRLGIDGLRANGQYGSVISAPNDLVVFAHYAAHGTWSKEVVDLFQAFFDVHRSGTFLDIGANIGVTTLPIAQRGDVTCLAFEPEPRNFRNLKQNIFANGVSERVRLFEMALFDREAELTLETDSENLGDNRVRVGPTSPGQFNEQTRATVSVQAARLDDVMNWPAAPPLAIKMDTQGAEPFIFAGGDRTLAKTDLIVLEFCPYLMHRMQADPKIVLAGLERHFPWASLTRFEGQNRTDGPWKPMAAALADLESYAHTDCQKAFNYVDVAAAKTAN